ncbi:Rad52/Rad22 family DNA repair protein [Paenibacillus cremeus]|nr:Rad52/Rad22 family DNA repair protein [Paenibacillus cremeus]
MKTMGDLVEVAVPKKHGYPKVVAFISCQLPAWLVKKMADGMLYLEDVIELGMNTLSHVNPKTLRRSELPMSNTANNLSIQLNAPFPYAAYGANYEGQAYVSVQWVVDRLNEVIGPLNWRHEFFDVTENMDDFSVELLGRLSIWDEGKQSWMDRVNWGNSTMTILRNETVPMAQDRMDCKKAAVSDSLKKCAAWFGVASDVFKGCIDVIKPKKADGTTNIIYSRLIGAYGFVDQYGSHRNGIPILPDSYQVYYKEKGWEGIFQSDLNALFSGNRTNCGESTAKDQGKSVQNESSQPSSILPEEQHPGASTGKGTTSVSRSPWNYVSGSGSEGSGSRGGTTSGSTSGSGHGSNKPAPLRMKVLDSPKFNQDGSATFKAKLENNSDVIVFAGKELAEEVRKIRPNYVLKTNGWYREDQQKVTLATKGGKIDIEAAA